MADLIVLSDEAKAEMVAQILTAFSELKRGVAHLQKCIDEVVESLPELTASLQEINKAVELLAPQLRVQTPEGSSS